MNNDNKRSKLIPVMLAFFTMGFVDLAGIATNYVKQDFSLSDTAANSFSVMVFLWFLLFSVPTGMLMNKIGRKKTVLLSMVVTFAGLSLPYFVYTEAIMFVVFSLLGIGNTLMQVSLNPLLASMVRKDRLPSYLTLGQFVKAVASFAAPLLAAQAVIYFGNWKLLFIIFAAINMLAIIYLYATDLAEPEEKNEPTSFKACFSLLGDGMLFLLFIGILVHVGIDVGMNITAPKLLQERAAMPLAEAGYATSLYFLFRTFGCLSGTFIMARCLPLRFFCVSVGMLLLGVTGLSVCRSIGAIYLCVALAGAGNSNIFSIIFSHALLYKPARSNEISGLMIMGITGGAIFPLLMGAASDALGNQNGAVMVLTVCVVYLLFLTNKLKKRPKNPLLKYKR